MPEKLLEALPMNSKYQPALLVCEGLHIKNIKPHNLVGQARYLWIHQTFSAVLAARIFAAFQWGAPLLCIALQSWFSLHKHCRKLQYASHLFVY